MGRLLTLAEPTPLATPCYSAGRIHRDYSGRWLPIAPLRRLTPSSSPFLPGGREAPTRRAPRAHPGASTLAVSSRPSIPSTFERQRRTYCSVREDHLASPPPCAVRAASGRSVTSSDFTDRGSTRHQVDPPVHPWHSTLSTWSVSCRYHQDQRSLTAHHRPLHSFATDDSSPSTSLAARCSTEACRINDEGQASARGHTTTA